MTIKKIASMANVSTTAVSFYLNNKRHKLSKATIERLDRIIEETGYKPSRVARNLRFQITNKVAIIVFDIAQDFAQKTFKSISGELEEDDFVISLYESHLNFEIEKKLIFSLIEAKINSIVIQPSKQMFNFLPQITKRFPDLKTKIILIDSKGKNKKYGYVYSDSDLSIEKNVQKKAQENIKLFYYLTDEISKLQIREYRYSNLKKLTDKYGITLKCILTKNDRISDKEMSKELQGTENTRKTFWANNSEIAFNLYKYLDTNNGINRNNSIVAFNECYFNPIVKIELDSINTKIYEMGKEAAKQIKDKETRITKIT